MKGLKTVKFLLILASVLVVSCKKECVPPAEVSFSRDIQPIFNASCLSSGCHSGSSPGGNLTLEQGLSYAELMDPAKGYVDTANPDESLLYSQMDSKSDPMPPTGKLSDCEIELVLIWITQNAKNN